LKRRIRKLENLKRESITVLDLVQLKATILEDKGIHLFPEYVTTAKKNSIVQQKAIIQKSIVPIAHMTEICTVKKLFVSITKEAP